MAHPHHESPKEHREKARSMLGRTGNKVPHGNMRNGYKSGGGITKEWDEEQDAHDIAKGVHAHESHLHKGEPKTKLKAGGHVEGDHARHHLGKRARGGHTGKGGKHVTNVIVAPQGGGAGGPPSGMPVPPRPMPPPAAAAPPPRPIMPPPQGAMPPGAGGPPMGMRPPGAMKRGGGLKHKRARGGEADCDEGEEREERARGGRTQNVREEGSAPWESMMTQKRGGNVRHRDMGGSAGVPADPTQMNPQALQRVAQIRKAQAQQQAMQHGGMGGMGGRPMQPPMSGAQAARMTPGNIAMQKSGGKVHVNEHERRARGGHVHMEAGAGGGEGRIEKTHEYGSGRGFKPRKVALRAP
jgi:hypothetical protein